MRSRLFNYRLVLHVFSNNISSKHLKITMKLFNLFRLLQFKKALIYLFIFPVRFHSFHSFENVVGYVLLLFFAIMEEIQERVESNQQESFPKT